VVQSCGASLREKTLVDIALPRTITLSPTATLAEAIKLMQEKQVRSLAILVSAGPGLPRWPVGILSCTDIVREMADL
jgi:CBS domain-containing protein